MENQIDYGIRWQEFNRRNELIAKEKFFSSPEARENFADKLTEKDNFYEITAMTRD